jgi:hypothetical protein
LQGFLQLSTNSTPSGNAIAVSKGVYSAAQRGIPLTEIELDYNFAVRYSKRSDYTGDARVIRHIQTWISTRLEHDESCQRPSQSSGMPSRLIYIGNPTLGFPARVFTTSPTRQLPYIALSHCWGGVDIPKLTKSSHDEMCISINPIELPRNFRDAIELCRMLEIHHLWADSLCIIQDSTEDWLSESVKMGTIYQNAVCTVAADASPNPYGGCFRTRNPLIHETLHLFTESGRVASIRLPGSTLESVLDSEINTAPLNTRGLASQERLLAKRMVHFGKNTVLFECNTLFAASLHPRVAIMTLGSGRRSSKTSRPHQVPGIGGRLPGP